LLYDSKSVLSYNNIVRFQNRKAIEMMSNDEVKINTGTKNILFIERQARITGCGVPCAISLDGVLVGSIGNKQKISIPIEPGHHEISMENAIGEPTTFAVQMPSDAGTTLVVSFFGPKEWKLIEKREASQTTITEVSGDTNSGATADIKTSSPIIAADLSGTYRKPLPFFDRLWKNVVVITAIYWIIRWLTPFLLPRQIRQLNFVESMAMCVIIALLLIGVLYLIRLGSSSDK
jgi:hypothetical protein